MAKEFDDLVSATSAIEVASAAAIAKLQAETANFIDPATLAPVTARLKVVGDALTAASGTLPANGQVSTP